MYFIFQNNKKGNPKIGLPKELPIIEII